MPKDFTRAPAESMESRLHREYAWSKHDGAITSNGIVFREQHRVDGSKAIKLYREPHHTDLDMNFAADDFQKTSAGAEVTVAEIHTVESWGVAPTP